MLRDSDAFPRTARVRSPSASPHRRLSSQLVERKKGLAAEAKILVEQVTPSVRGLGPGSSDHSTLVRFDLVEMLRIGVIPLLGAWR